MPSFVRRFDSRSAACRPISHAAIALVVCSPLALVLPHQMVSGSDADTTSETVDSKSSPEPITLQVFPSRVVLQNQRSRAHLVVTATRRDGVVRDLTQVARFESDDPSVVRMTGRRAEPRAPGETTVAVEAAGAIVRVPVVVKSVAEPDTVPFEYGLLPALTKQGCNSGACHGSPNGKGGFRLSLRGYDPASDEMTLTRDAFARRSHTLRLAASLILLKGTQGVPHGGGKRLQASDAAYRVVEDWIAAGCRPDAPGTPRCVSIEVYPRRRIFHFPARRQQLSVLAHFSDESVRDVTPLAVFSSSDDNVATVNAHGLIEVQTRGEAAVTASFQDHTETSLVMSLRDVDGFTWTPVETSQPIDRIVFEKLRLLNILPSTLCTDAEFIRRLFLDVLGILPTTFETRSFLADQDPEKRSHLIDHVLARPEYAEFWALKWADLLRLQPGKMSPPGVHKFHRWLVASVRRNVPYDEFAGALLTAEGSTFASPAANYFRALPSPSECAEATSQVFLGIRIQCAKCHNHPFDRWTQDNYYGIAAVFGRLQSKQKPAASELVVWQSRTGEVTQPRTGVVAAPWVPGHEDFDVPPGGDRRRAFVDWLQEPSNPYFAKVEVNRIWGHLFGRGIVEPVDDFRSSNPPAHEELLEYLADAFVERGYDRRSILREILHSRVYQLSSRANRFNGHDEKYFSRAYARLLSAEQLLDAICTVTEVPESFAGLPAGIRAAQTPSPVASHDFLKVFGQPSRESSCECERTGDASLAAALEMVNGEVVRRKLRDEGNRISRLLASKQSDDELVTEFYLAAFGRLPSGKEVKNAVDYVTAQASRREAFEDLCWSLLNAKEFLFQH